jgi:hypothetical protein
MKNTKHPEIARIGLSLLATGFCHHAMAEEPLFSLAPAADHVQLGSGFAVLGDLNEDGVADLAVVDRSARVAPFLGSGIVHVIDGANGSPIRDHTGVPSGSQGFGSSLVALNADGDGIPDLAVGAPGQKDASGILGAGAVYIYAGSDGSLLQTILGPSGSQLGAALANAGDQNGDGFDDLYAGAPSADARRGIVLVLSSQNGGSLRTISTTAATSSFGATLVAMGDLDGDGLADVAIGAPSFKLSTGNPAGRVILARSSDGATAATLAGTEAFNQLGESLALAADANGDGVPDLLIGSYSGGTGLLVSGANLTVLKNLSIPTLPAYRPLTVGGSLDFNQDGVADWLIGSPALKVESGKIFGGFRVISGVDQQTLFERIASEPNSNLGRSLMTFKGLGMAAGEISLRDPVTNGSGYAYVWKLAEEVLDSDGDGINDDMDEVPNSIMTPTVVIGGVDSGVTNRVNATGVSLADRFTGLGEIPDHKNSGKFLAKAKQLSNQLFKAGLVTRKESRQLADAALKAHLKAVSRR